MGLIHFLSKSVKSLSSQMKEMQMVYDAKIAVLEKKCVSLDKVSDFCTICEPLPLSTN